MRAKLPQVQPKCALESGLKQSAFQQTDTPIKRALLEACCVVSLLWTERRRVAHRLSLLPFCISAHPFWHTKTTSLFLLSGTHTLPFSFVWSNSGPTGWGFFPCARLAPVKAGENRRFCQCCIYILGHRLYLYLIVLFCNNPLCRGWATVACLSVSCIPV